MKSEMETIQILSSKLREEELENERLRRERDAESEKALRAVEDARVARKSAEQYRVQLEEERKAQGDRIESMLKEVMLFITGKGTVSLSETLSDSIIKKMQEQHAKELAEQKAAGEGLFWGSHTSAERLSVILTIVRSALMNSLNVYQYIVCCLKTIRSYKGDLTDLLANKWKPSETELMPILA